jgi:hypothetical protein
MRRCFGVAKRIVAALDGASRFRLPADFLIRENQQFLPRQSLIRAWSKKSEQGR